MDLERVGMGDALTYQCEFAEMVLGTVSIVSEPQAQKYNVLCRVRWVGVKCWLMWEKEE